MRYRLGIRGTIGDPLVAPLEGMEVVTDGPETVLVGDIVDQAQLRGIVAWLNDVGVEIVSINPSPAP